jgi:hypothetical protein
MSRCIRLPKAVRCQQSRDSPPPPRPAPTPARSARGSSSGPRGWDGPARTLFRRWRWLAASGPARISKRRSIVPLSQGCSTTSSQPPVRFRSALRTRRPSMRAAPGRPLCTLCGDRRSQFAGCGEQDTAPRSARTRLPAQHLECLTGADGTPRHRPEIRKTRPTSPPSESPEDRAPLGWHREVEPG